MSQAHTLDAASEAIDRQSPVRAEDETAATELASNDRWVSHGQDYLSDELPEELLQEI